MVHDIADVFKKQRFRTLYFGNSGYVIEERALNFIMESRPSAKLKLKVHPFIAAYLQRGFPSLQMKWTMKYVRWLKIQPDNDFPITSFKFYDKDDEEIKLN